MPYRFDHKCEECKKRRAAIIRNGRELCAICSKKIAKKGEASR